MLKYAEEVHKFFDAKNEVVPLNLKPTKGSMNGRYCVIRKVTTNEKITTHRKSHNPFTIKSCYSNSILHFQVSQDPSKTLHFHSHLLNPTYLSGKLVLVLNDC